jgi:hypothetical protein
MGLRREVWVGVSPDRNSWGGSDLIQDSLDVYDAVKSLPLKGKAKRLASEGRYVRSEEILKALKPLPRPN